MQHKYCTINSPARGNKKLLKDFLPILAAVKLTAAVVLGINLIAKKVIFVSLVSFAFSALLAAREPESEGASEGQRGVERWVFGQLRHCGSHCSSTAHTLAYGTQKCFPK
jgi:hypothetical protein